MKCLVKKVSSVRKDSRLTSLSSLRPVDLSNRPHWPISTVRLILSDNRSTLPREVVFKLSQSCPKVVPKLSQNCLKVVPKLSQNQPWSPCSYFPPTQCPHCSKNGFRMAPILITADNYDREYNWWQLHLSKSCLSKCVPSQSLLFLCNPKIWIFIFCNCYTIQTR